MKYFDVHDIICIENFIQNQRTSAFRFKIITCKADKINTVRKFQIYDALQNFICFESPSIKLTKNELRRLKNEQKTSYRKDLLVKEDFL